MNTPIDLFIYLLTYLFVRLFILKIFASKATHWKADVSSQLHFPILFDATGALA